MLQAIPPGSKTDVANEAAEVGSVSAVVAAVGCRWARAVSEPSSLH